MKRYYMISLNLVVLLILGSLYGKTALSFNDQTYISELETTNDSHLTQNEPNAFIPVFLSQQPDEITTSEITRHQPDIIDFSNLSLNHTDIQIEWPFWDTLDEGDLIASNWQTVNTISAGASHSCAVTTDGGVKCWGYNSIGQLGDGTNTTRIIPIDVLGLSSDVMAITVGLSHTCALTTGGGVKCWGSNSKGQLGDGSTTSSFTPVNVSGLSSGVMAIAAGGSHTCALTTGGGVKCWGNNEFGQLGDGTTIKSSTPVDVNGLTNVVVAITAGDSHTCALTTGGGVKCWGNNVDGRLGDGTTTNRYTPVDVSGLSSGVSNIAAGSYHTCGLTSGGGMKCWGNNEYGQLGDGTTIARTEPVEVSGLSSGVSDISTGLYHTCAVTTEGGAKCWGYNEASQLGDGTTIDRNTPVQVNGLTNGVSVITAGGLHTCALTSEGGVKCWGYNFYGQLGDGTPITRATPVDVSELSSGIINIALGSYHTCALTSEEGVKCWGRNDSGQLGDATITNRFNPVDTSGLISGVMTIAAGSYHTCALTSEGGVKCWGNNVNGRLGDGTTTDRYTPVDVNGLSSGVIAIAAGGSHTCALTSEGGVKCWGINGTGQLGDGTIISRTVPVDVSGLSNGVTSISAGFYHTCIVTTEGGAKCWGYNSEGQLGDGTTANRYTPVQVSGLSSGVSAITVGGFHTGALITDGEMMSWGSNNYGQLGDGTYLDRYTPVDVFGMGSVVSRIVGGGYHTCALTDGGDVKCWGYDNYGQLGDGSFRYSATPVSVSGLSPDIIPPEVVPNLTASTGMNQGEINLIWIAPGDDYNHGVATTYEIRHNTQPLTEANWNVSTIIAGLPTPAIAGTFQSIVVSGLTPGQVYYFALKTQDEVPNTSPISNNSSAQAARDTTPPAAVTNLAASTGGASGSVNLSWTAPGDDGNTGTASNYIIRYNTLLITEANWSASTDITGEPAPAPAGTTQSMTVTGLTPGQTYFFAIKSQDEVPNTSPISNSPSAQAKPIIDITPPAAVANLAAVTGSASGSVNLSWTAPGDDGNTGTASNYIVRYNTLLITEANWSASTDVTGEPAPAPAGTTQSMTVTGLNPGQTYFFAIKSQDEVPNTSPISNSPAAQAQPVLGTTAGGSGKSSRRHWQRFGFCQFELDCTWR